MMEVPLIIFSFIFISRNLYRNYSYLITSVRTAQILDKEINIDIRYIIVSIQCE
jgi:hypothetical protein